MINNEVHLNKIERRQTMKKLQVGMMALLLMASILAACSEDKKEQTNQTDDSEEVEETEEAEETEEDANEETQDQEEGSIEDQRDLTIKETGTFQSTLGTYEVTLESAQIVGEELDGKASLYEELIVLDLTFKNIGDETLLAEEITADMQITDDLDTSGAYNGAEEFDSIEVFQGEIQPGEEKAAQFIGDIYTADEYFFRKAEGNVATGTSNQVIWTIPDEEARNN